MAIGTFGDIVFQVSDEKIFTPHTFSMTVGSEWATHDNIGGKQKSEYVGSSLRKISFDITLSAEMGVNPRKLLQRLEQMAEGSEAYLLVIGGKPIGAHLWRLVSLSEEWQTVLNRGEVISATASISLEEYV